VLRGAKTSGGDKVLNINWGENDTVEVVSVRRGDWEQLLIRELKQTHH
jgi:hypothetical protein